MQKWCNLCFTLVLVVSYKVHNQAAAHINEGNIQRYTPITWYTTATHSFIWRPSRVADTPPLLPISRYGYCLFAADVCL